MKHLLLEVSIVAAVAALMLLGAYLFTIERSFDIPSRDFSTGGGNSELRIMELEEHARELEARLDESEGRVAQWERSCLEGMVPEYFRGRLQSGTRREGFRNSPRSGAYRGAVPGSQADRERGWKASNAGDPAQNGALAARSKNTRTKDGGASGTGNEKQAERNAAEKSYSAGLIGLYHKGRHFEDLKLVLTDYDVDFDFADQSPDAMLGEDNFSIRWTGYIRIDRAGTYSFQTLSDDGVRLWVAGRPVIDNWGDHSATWNSGDVYLKEGYHSLRLDFYENGGVAAVKLCWSSDRFDRETIPPACLYHDPDLELKLRKELH